MIKTLGSDEEGCRHTPEKSSSRANLSPEGARRIAPIAPGSRVPGCCRQPAAGQAVARRNRSDMVPAMQAPRLASSPLVFESVSTGWPSPSRTLQPILHGLAQTPVQQCQPGDCRRGPAVSGHCAGCSARGIPDLPNVEHALGFTVSGLKVPLSLTQSHRARPP